MQQRIIRRYEVQHLTGLSASTIYALIQEGEFPKQIKLGKRAVGWLVSEIETWVRDRHIQSRPSPVEEVCRHD